MCSSKHFRPFDSSTAETSTTTSRATRDTDLSCQFAVANVGESRYINVGPYGSRRSIMRGNGTVSRI